MSIERKQKTSNFVLITLFSLIYQFGMIRYGNVAGEVSFSSPLGTSNIWKKIVLVFHLSWNLYYHPHLQRELDFYAPCRIKSKKVLFSIINIVN